jgi:hypothetical protein
MASTSKLEKDIALILELCGTIPEQIGAAIATVMEDSDAASKGLTAETVRAIVSEELRRTTPTPTFMALPSSSPLLYPTAVSTSTVQDIKPILLHDDHRQALELLLGGPLVGNADEVVSWVKRLCSVRIDGPDGKATTVSIPLDTLERLDSRRPVDTSLQEMLQAEVSDFLERFINGER